MLNIITGANDGIGLALFQRLLELYPEDHFLLTARNVSTAKSTQKIIYHRLEATNEQDYLDLANHCKSIDQEIRFCINSIGVLEGSILEKPERKISEIDIEKLSYSFQVNALPILLLTKYLFPCLRKSSSLRLIQISAKLGSIQDNELGGWYSYRLSKAAGNMGLKNISIELKRYNPSAVCISIHPGTCDTKFTQNFLESAKSRYKVHTATESANNILEVIRNLNPSDSGQFFNWDGQKLDF